MNLSISQAKILHILWTSETSMSIKEIANHAKYHLASSIIVSLIVDELLAKKAVVQSGVFSSFSRKRECKDSYFLPNIQFADYYAKIFEDIAPQNVFRLLDKLLRSDKLTSQMLRELNGIIMARVDH